MMPEFEYRTYKPFQGSRELWPGYTRLKVYYERGKVWKALVQVYAYSVEFGRVLGSSEAHDDTVSCLLVKNDRLYTASADCSVRAWR